MRRRTHGLTLIELIVVIALVGVLAGIGFSQLNYGSFATRQGAQVVSAVVNRARLEAIRSHGVVVLEATAATGAGNGRVRVCRVTTTAGATCDMTGAVVIQTVDFSGGDLARARIVTDAAGAAVRVVFDRRGIVLSGAPATIGVTDQAGANARTVTIAITGRTDVQ